MTSTEIGGLAATIAAELESYRQSVTDGLKEEIKKVSDECAKEVRMRAKQNFAGSGAYAKGWKARIVYENAENIRIVIYNPKHYQIAHLLEYGHAKVNGGRVEGRPHIRPAEQNAEKTLEKRVKVAVRGT